jgi:hypothetical protein
MHDKHDDELVLQALALARLALLCALGAAAIALAAVMKSSN